MYRRCSPLCLQRHQRRRGEGFAYLFRKLLRYDLLYDSLSVQDERGEECAVDLHWDLRKAFIQYRFGDHGQIHLSVAFLCRPVFLHEFPEESDDTVVLP